MLAKISDASNSLLFICGFPGGGTDLVKTVLNAHPEIYINGEMPFIKNLAKFGYGENFLFTDIEAVRAFQNTLGGINTWNNIENIAHDFTEELDEKVGLSRDEVLRTCFSRKAPLIWGNKTPQNTENIALLAKIFPHARFLIVVRDVRDVCLSWRNKWGKDMIWCAAKWDRRMKQGWFDTRRLSSDRYRFLRFEDLLLDIEHWTRIVCDFLEIPFAKQMLEHHRYTTERIDGKINYGQKIIKDNKNKWPTLLPAKTIKRIEEIAFDAMRIFGYRVSLASRSQPILKSETIRGVAVDIFATLVVGNRARKNNTIRNKVIDGLFELRKQITK
jgi:hypothetical protein